MARPMTITEKIMARSAGLKEVIPGQIITANIGLVYTTDFQAKAVFDHFKSLGASKVFELEKVLVFFDHFTPPPDIHYANLHNDIRRMAREFHVRLYDVGRHGIMHHVVAEDGYLVPGIIAVGTDSHALTGGGIGAVVMGVGATDAAV